jgi:hypothetical protein
VLYIELSLAKSSATTAHKAGMGPNNLSVVCCHPLSSGKPVWGKRFSSYRTRSSHVLLYKVQPQDHWVLRPDPSSKILMIENTTFQILGLFPTTDEERETPTLLGPLELTSINGPQVKGGRHLLCWVP